ncbi:MAG: ATP-NAD kinase family protein [Sedimentibacter sp.]
MTSIGIIANPNSGKDIRRLISHASVIDNGEKANMVERIILGAQALGVQKVYMLSDFNRIGFKVKDKLTTRKVLKCNIELVELPYYNSFKDTMNITEFMENNNVGCIVTLGGDGTNRALAKVIKNTPIITISTGTNNVYPVMIEGTIAGMAAAAVASQKFNKNDYAIKDKRIEIYKNSELIDIALVDAVISDETYIASKAIWDMENIYKIFVTRSHPASIGFSSIVGCKKIIVPQDDFGACLNVNKSKNYVTAAVSAGVMEQVFIDDLQILEISKEYEFTAQERGTIALDGEKEVEFSPNDTFTFKITRNGPYHVDVLKALEIAQLDGFLSNN